MKKKMTTILLALLTCMITVGACAMGIQRDESKPKQQEIVVKQLIDQKNQFVVAEIEGDHIQFNDPVLEEQMKDLGILIPLSQRKYFHDKTRITFDDPQFLQAFESYFIPANIHKGSYKWTEAKTSS